MVSPSCQQHRQSMAGLFLSSRLRQYGGEALSVKSCAGKRSRGEWGQ